MIHRGVPHQPHPQTVAPPVGNHLPLGLASQCFRHVDLEHEVRKGAVRKAASEEVEFIRADKGEGGVHERRRGEVIGSVGCEHGGQVEVGVGACAVSQQLPLLLQCFVQPKLA